MSRGNSTEAAASPRPTIPAGRAECIIAPTRMPRRPIGTACSLALRAAPRARLPYRRPSSSSLPRFACCSAMRRRTPGGGPCRASLLTRGAELKKVPAEDQPPPGHDVHTIVCLQAHVASNAGAMPDERQRAQSAAPAPGLCLLCAPLAPRPRAAAIELPRRLQPVQPTEGGETYN
eukprot:261386-Chlamydomonas_euryale.AAC.4